jgi:hypothetical protein
MGSPPQAPCTICANICRLRRRQSCRLVRDVNNAAKHNTLHQVGNPPRRLSRADQIYEMRVTTLYEDDQGEFPASQTEVFVRLDDASEVVLAQVLHRVMDMWCAHLDGLGIITMTNPETFPADVPLTRAEAANKPSDMEYLRGEQRTWPMKLRRFNYEKMIAEPVDLTGSKIEMRIFRPPTKAVLHCNAPNLGVSIDIDIPLSEEEGVTFATLSNEEERARFAHDLVAGSPKLQAVVQEAIQQALDARIMAMDDLPTG